MQSIPIANHGSNALRIALYRTFVLPNLQRSIIPKTSHLNIRCVSTKGAPGRGSKRPIPQLTRLTPLPINAEIRSPKVLLRTAADQSTSLHRTADLLRHLSQTNHPIAGTGAESFLVQLASGSSSAASSSNNNNSNVPYCALLTRDELRERARQQQRREREVARRERRAKELDMNWTVGERDMQLQAARLAEFLEAGFRVTLNLVQPRRRAPVGPERAQEIVEGVREAVKGVLGVSVAESVTGTLGKTMMMEFRPAGMLGPKKNEKAVTVQMPINSVALETKLTEIKAALRKGVNVEVKVEEPEPDAKTKSSLSEQEIWQRIRTVVRGVKDAVETNIKDSDARSKLFKAEYTKADLPRIIEIESDLGANMLDVRGQWVSTWLQQGIPVRIFVHGKQHEASGANSPEVVERSETQLQRLINAVQAAGQRPLISTKDEETEGSEFGEWYSLALAAKEVEIEPPRPQIKASKQPIQWQQPQKNHQPHMNRSYEDILHSMSQSAGNG